MTSKTQSPTKKIIKKVVKKIIKKKKNIKKTIQKKVEQKKVEQMKPMITLKDTVKSTIPDPVIKKGHFTFIDLCSGTGGFHMAMDRIKEIKSQVILAADVDVNCRKVYEMNHNLEVHDDLTTIDTDEHHPFDAIFAGFPCQPFSVAGKRMGLDDARGTIIHYIFEMIRKVKPKFICLENVKGLKSLKNKDKNGAEVQAYNLIYNVLADLGYLVTDRVISPHEVNIPQVRERVVILGIRKDLVRDDIKTNEDLSRVVLTDIENMIVQRRKENEGYKIFDNISTVHPKFRLDAKLSDYPTEEIEGLNEKELKKLQKKITTKNMKATSLDLWDKFVSMKEWDEIDNKELQECYKKATGDKRCSKNFKQEHFFIDFLHYKNSNVMPESLNYTGRRNLILCKTFKNKCDLWNILYENHEGLRQLIDTFLTQYHSQFLELPLQQRYLEYSGGEDYGSENTLSSKYCQFRMSGVRIRKGTTFPTLVKSGPMPIYIKEKRYLTFEEGARLQSLKPGFKFVNDSSAMKQLGNGVNVQVIELMMRGALKQIFPDRFTEQVEDNEEVEDINEELGEDEQ